MKYRALDKNGDFTFGRRLFYTNQEAVAQAISTRLKLLFGEWWENRDDGMPLFEQIVGVYNGDSAREAIDLIISERIQKTENVTRVVSYKSNFDANTREYSAICVVDTSFGEISLSLSENLAKVEVI